MTGWSCRVSGKWIVGLLLIALAVGCADESPKPPPPPPENQPPVARADRYGLLSNEQTLTVDAAEGVLGNDRDPEGEPIRARLTVAPLHAAENGFRLNPDGSFVYVPDRSGHPSDFFAYRVSDGEKESAEVEVEIDIIPPVEDDSYTVRVLAEPLLRGAAEGVLANDPDDGVTPRYARLVRPPAHHDGEFVLARDGSFEYRFAGGDAETDSFSYVVGNGVRESRVATVTLTLWHNTPPVAEDIYWALDKSGTVVRGSLADRVTDRENEMFHFRDVTPSERRNRGTLTIDRITGAYSYIPATTAGSYQDEFIYEVDDLYGGVATGRIKFAIAPCRIMPLGDSITYGVMTSSIDSKTGELVIGPVEAEAVGYRLPLKRRLEADGIATDFVGNRRAGYRAGLSDSEHQGIPGIRSQEVRDAVAGWLDQSPPDVVLLHIGTNNWTDKGLDPDVSSIDEILQRIAAWSKKNNNPVEIFLAKIIGIYPFDNVVGEFNANLEAMIRKKWPDVTLVDMYSALDYPDDITPLDQDLSALHPTVVGYRKMADTWFDALRASGVLERCRD